MGGGYTLAAMPTAVDKRAGIYGACACAHACHVVSARATATTAAAAAAKRKAKEQKKTTIATTQMQNYK